MMQRTSPVGAITVVVLLLTLACSSCGVNEQDSPFDPANLGNVVIAVSPSGLTPAWTLDGPAGAHRTGTGPMTVGSLAAGSYTVTWGVQAGFEMPQPGTGELLAGSTLTLTGQYAALAPGTIQITCSPVDLAGPWRLEWNEGANFLTGTGSQVLTNRPAGAYMIHWLATDGWFSPSPASQAFTLPVGGEVPVTGVWTQMPPGTIQIDPNPDNLNAPWTLTGPAGYQRTGTGDNSLPSMPSGAYSLVWGAVNGWTSPQPALITGTLATGGTYLFRGDYTQVPPVTITVNVTPDNIASAWQLTGPGGFALTQAGDWSLGGLPAGEYTITWGSAPSGWNAPSPATASYEVAAGASRTFAGTYTEIPPATIIVDVSPNTVTAPWQLAGPGGYTLSRSGDWTASGLVAGQYTITWGNPGSNWIMPSPASLSYTVSAGGSHAFSGAYVEILPVTIAVNVTPDNITAQWQLTGPNGFSVTRAGDWSQVGLENGLYTITWGNAGSDWTGPSPATASRTVAAGESYTFTGNYSAITRVGLFSTNDGATLSSSTSWSASNQATVYILLINPDPSGVAYWDLKVVYAGGNTVMQETSVVGGTDGSPYGNTFLVTMPTGSPIPPNAENVAYVGALSFYSGTRSTTTVTLAPVNEIGYTPATPMYKMAAAPTVLVPLLPYNGSWSTPAFTIVP